MYGSQRHFLVVASLILLAGLLHSNPANADVNSVTASPASVTVPLGQTRPVTISWRVNRTETVSVGGPFTRLVSSPSASLIINGATVANIAGSLSTTSVLPSGGTSTVTLTESIILSPGQLRLLADSAAGSARIERTFSDTQTSGTGSVSVYAGSAGVGELTVRRIDLAFQNAARSEVVKQDESLFAVADIAFSSSGVLRGEWRLVDPSTSLGSQSGRVLQVVRQSLLSAGQGRTRITSPKLPTDRSGLHLLAFAVEQDGAQIEIPVLRYFVIEKSGKTIVEPFPMRTLTPAADASLSEQTVFAWQPVESATAYQLEIFATGEAQPLTGKLVPASEQQLSLSAMSLDWLEDNTQYQWQVRALGNQGQLLAISAKQPINMP
ncbi:hypothetical protein [Methylophaga sp.]|uniref:hypothetical protein n=1 Tax=Methylophaga sp. TaxID=2024840 RepID=UPI003F6A0262